MLKSVKEEATSVKLIYDVKGMCQAGGFKLTKFASNSRKVLDSIHPSDHAKGLKNLDFSKEELPVEKALGVYWDVEKDIFTFKLNMKEKPLTRRGMLSCISSVYDPLGFAAPFLLDGRKVIQKLCKEKKNWDEAVTEEQKEEWNRWRESLNLLEIIEVSRCFKSAEMESIADVSLHHFSDASEEGYGQVTYVRMVDDRGNINCNIV